MNALRLCFASLALLPGLVLAHASSQAYVQLKGDAQHTELRVDVALRDLDAALDLDASGDAQLSWGELRGAQASIQRWASDGLRLQGCTSPWAAAPLALETRGDGLYAVLRLRADCALPAGQPLQYNLLGDVDPTHRALLRIERAGQAPQLALLAPTAPTTETRIALPPLAMALAPAQAEPAFWQEGMHHLVTGYDHLLFLLCLILPAVLRRKGGGWQPVPRLRDALVPVAAIVSAFTLAHSLTLALAALGHVALPSSVVEPLIALSIVLAALDNIRPFLQRLLRLPRWGIAFGFGLIHGFGFAGVLGELALPAASLAWALVQFNLGLELAQLGVVVLAGSLLYSLRRWAGYPRWVLQAGSGLAAALGAFWVLQRVS